MRTHADMVRRATAGTHAIIDLDAFIANIRELRRLAGESVAFMAVVKADAYGHGIVQCSRALTGHADWIGVARIHEGVLLRRRGVGLPILVLGPPNVEEIDHAVTHDITLTVGTHEHIEAVERVASGVGIPASVHLKVDTGMRRYGFMPSESAHAARSIAGNEWLRLDGIYTHFSSSDEADQTPTDLQLSEFHAVVERLRQDGLRPSWVHCANSAAILSGRTGNTNLVRSGIATYGLSPSDEVPITAGFRQALTLRTVVTRVFELQAGDAVSYCRTYVAAQPEVVAATGAGYADGLPRQLSNTGWFVHEGRRLPIRGRVCMDQTVVAAHETLQIGDVVTIVGPGSDGTMTLDDVATIADTNNYEIATRVTARVPRVYIRDGQVVAIEHELLGESVEALEQ